MYIKVWQRQNERGIKHLCIEFFESGQPSEAGAIERASAYMTANPDAYWATWPTGYKGIPGVYEGPRSKQA